MASTEDIKKLKILTGEKNEDLLSVLLDEAEAFVLSYTNRTQLRTGLEKAVRDLAVIALNRMGTEGEKCLFCYRRDLVGFRKSTG